MPYLSDRMPQVRAEMQHVQTENVLAYASRNL